MPPSLNESFVGRSDDLFRIHFALSTLRGTPAIAAALSGAIEGGGGFGKTRLALEYVWRFGPTYYPGGVFWLVADQSEAGIDQQFYNMLRELQPNAPEFNIFKQQHRDIRAELGKALQEIAIERPVLFVVDNLPSAEPKKQPRGLADYCPAVGAVTLLVTSRSHIYESYVYALPIAVLERASSVALITSKSNGRNELNHDEWAEIAEWVGDLPLALEILNKSLRARCVTPKELLVKARSPGVTKEIDQQFDALRGQIPAGSIRGVTEVLSISCKTLSPDSRRASRLLAWFASEPVPLALFHALIDKADASRIQAELLSRSLLTGAPATMYEVDILGTMHRVMADYIRAQVRAPRRDLLKVCKAISTIMTAERCADPQCWTLMNLCSPHATGIFWRAMQEYRYSGPTTRVLTELFARALRMFDLGDKQLAEAIVEVGLCARNLLYSQALYADALKYVDTASQLADEVLGEKSELALTARLALADVLRMRNDLPRMRTDIERAETLEQEVVDSYRQLRGEKSIETMAAMNNLANTLCRLQRWHEAKEIFETVLDFDRRVVGERNRETVTAMHNLAVALTNCGDIDRASSLEHQAWQLYCELLGESHPDALRSYMFLATQESNLARRVENAEINSGRIQAELRRKA